MQDAEILTDVARLKEWLRENRQLLQDTGIVSIVGEYQGEGDEGQFQETHAVDRDGGYVSYEFPEEITDLIESLADKLATPGYEDGNGGGGEVRLDVEAGSVVHEAYSFFTERLLHGEETY